MTFGFVDQPPRRPLALRRNARCRSDTTALRRSEKKDRLIRESSAHFSDDSSGTAQRTTPSERAALAQRTEIKRLSGIHPRKSAVP